MASDDFTRDAALRVAEAATAEAVQLDPLVRAVAQAGGAVVLGLVYIGDQVRWLAELREPRVVSAVRIVSPEVVTVEMDGVSHVLHAGDEVRTRWGGARDGVAGE